MDIFPRKEAERIIQEELDGRRVDPSATIAVAFAGSRDRMCTALVRIGMRLNPVLHAPAEEVDPDQTTVSELLARMPEKIEEPQEV